MVEGGFEETAGLDFGRGELGFQAVAEGYQFSDFGDDAVLLGERTEPHREREQDGLIQVLHRCPNGGSA